jgi:DNA-binding PadR family transcriptional regulator
MFIICITPINAMAEKNYFEALKTKPAKRLMHSLTYGNIWLSVLSLVKSRKKAYAYELDKEIEKEFLFKPNKVMVYVVLYKLEDEKMIKSEFEERRKYYALTDKGAQMLDFGKRYLSALSKKL